MFLVLGFICVIFGFLCYCKSKKNSQTNSNLRMGTITEIEKVEDGYNLKVSYDRMQLYEAENSCLVEEVVFLKKKPNTSEIIIEMNENGIEVYSKKKTELIASIILWVLGAILFALA